MVFWCDYFCLGDYYISKGKRLVFDRSQRTSVAIRTVCLSFRYVAFAVETRSFDFFVFRIQPPVFNNTRFYLWI